MSLNHPKGNGCEGGSSCFLSPAGDEFWGWHWTLLPHNVGIPDDTPAHISVILPLWRKWTLTLRSLHEHTHIIQHRVGFILAYFRWRTCLLGGETADSDSGGLRESSSLRTYHSLERQNEWTQLFTSASRGNWCQWWPMIKSTLDRGHAWLTLIRTLWKHALAWGCLSPINIMAAFPLLSLKSLPWAERY